MKWLINFQGLYNAKALLVEEQWGTIERIDIRDKGIYILIKGISPKVNTMLWLKFEPALMSLESSTLSYIDR